MWLPAGSFDQTLMEEVSRGRGWGREGWIGNPGVMGYWEAVLGS